jgi:predicted nucleic acid-binding Zn ribbon protein
MPFMTQGGPERLAEILSRLVTQRGWGQLQQRRRLEEAWKQAAGPEASERSRVGLFRRGQLEVIVADAVLHHELRFAKARILAELARRLGAEQVKELRFRLGAIGG